MADGSDDSGCTDDVNMMCKKMDDDMTPTSQIKLEPNLDTSKVDDVLVTPISQINKEQRFTIKARVTSKSTIREWHNEYRSGIRLFFNVEDDSGEIRCISFDREATEMDNIIEVGTAYTMKNMHAKEQDKDNKDRYRLAIKHEFELFVEEDYVIDDCDDKLIPHRTYEFVKINQLKGMADVNEVKAVDVIGICVGVSELKKVKSYNQHTQQHQLWDTLDLSLVDETTGLDPVEGITLTLWDKQALEFKQPGGTPFVVVAKRARLSSYNGGILNSGDSNMINPVMSLADTLTKWFNNANK